MRKYRVIDNNFRVVTVHRVEDSSVVGVHMFGPPEKSLYDAMMQKGPGEGFYILVSIYSWSTTFRKDHNAEAAKRRD